MKHQMILLNIFHTHNQIALLVYEFNHFFKFITFIIYFMSTPAILVSLYLSFHRESTLVLKYFIAFILVFSLTLVVIMNIMSSWITRAAHRPRNILLSYLAKHRNIPLILRLKLHTYVERLSGPDIGFYCLHLFPINSWELFQYFYISGMNMLLIMGYF